MPTRLVREGFLSSDRISKAGEQAEILFFRLMLVADDYGRFDGRLSVICRACWPIGLTTDPTPQEVGRRLDLLTDQALVVRYEVDGKPFIYIPKFKQRTRAMKSKCPEPPANASQMPVKRQADDGHPSVKRPSTAGHMTAETETYAETEAKSVSDSDSNAERARELGPGRDPIQPAEPRGPVPAKLPDELPTAYLARVAGKPPRRPRFDDDLPMEGIGT